MAFHAGVFFVSKENPPFVYRQKEDPVCVLLFPVVPDVLDIVIIFHDVDELFHQGHMLGIVQSLIVLGNHFDLGENTGKIGEF